MELVIDCEWNGVGGALLSMALVPRNRDIAPFYEEIVLEEPVNPWVAEHVIPHLQLERRGLWLPDFRNRLGEYLNQFDDVEIVADWPEDISRFCMMLITGPGERMDTPALHFRIERIDVHGEIPHNALSDAIAMRDYLFASDLEPSLVGKKYPSQEEKLLEFIQEGIDRVEANR